MKKVFFVLTLFCIPAIWFLISPGGYEPHDLHHLADIHQMHAAFSSGQIPPRLGPDFLFGFGYPLFNFYYVLPFYLGAFFYALTGSLMTSFELVFIASVLGSVWGMYLLLRKFFDRWASFAGALVYLYTPFRAVEIYVRGAIGEALAIAIFPWVLYVLANLIERTNKKNIAVTSVVLALFYITHNYFFLLVAPFTLLYVCLLVYSRKERFRTVKALIVAGCLSVGLSAYWWLPAFFEHSLVSSFTPFVIEDHFPFVKQLLLPSWGYGSSVWGPGDMISFQIGVVNLAMAALAVVYLIKQRREKLSKYKVSFLALMFFFGAVFMMNIRSLFLWELIPFTNFIQFPWRFLTLTTLFTAFLTGFVVENSKFRRVVAVLVVGVSILLTFSYFRPSKVTFTSDEEYLKRFFSNTQYSEDYLQLPLDSLQKPDTVFEQKFAVENGQIVSEDKMSDISWKAVVNAAEATEVQAYVLDFPGWFVEVDGERVETYPSGSYGQLTFNVGSGIHEVELYWGETKLRLLADFVSLGSLGIVIFLYFSTAKKKLSQTG